MAAPPVIPAPSLPTEAYPQRFPSVAALGSSCEKRTANEYEPACESLCFDPPGAPVGSLDLRPPDARHAAKRPDGTPTALKNERERRADCGPLPISHGQPISISQEPVKNRGTGPPRPLPRTSHGGSGRQPAGPKSTRPHDAAWDERQSQHRMRGRCPSPNIHKETPRELFARGASETGGTYFRTCGHYHRPRELDGRVRKGNAYDLTG